MITKKEVEHIANLARLKLSPQEMKKMEKELSAILQYFDSLKKINVKEIKPTSQSIFLKNVMREDITKKQPAEKTNKLLKAMPEKKGRYVKVKSVL